MAAASWGVGDFSGGIATRLSNNFVAVFVAQGVGLVVASVLLALSSEPMPSNEALAWGAAAGVSGAFGLGSFYLALSRGTMGLVAPAAALLSAAWPAAFALLTGDAVSALALAGMGIALVSIVLISLPDRRVGTPVMPTYHGSRRNEWLLILGAALGFGGFFLFIDASHAAGGAVWWPLFTVKLAGVMAVVAAALVLAPLGRFPGIEVGAAALLVACIAGLGRSWGQPLLPARERRGPAGRGHRADLALPGRDRDPGADLPARAVEPTAGAGRGPGHLRGGPHRAPGRRSAQLNQPAPEGQRIRRTAMSTPNAASTRMVAAAMASSRPAWNSL